MTAHEHYFEYLQGRGRLGLWYRRYWLYPRLCRFLDGQTLDVGCGIGDFLRYRHGTVGVDINPATVEWCRKQGLDARMMSPDRLPFEDAVFDGVILDNVLEHLLAPKALLQEIRRVLRPGATFVVGVPGRRGYTSDPDHKVYYDANGLIETMKAAQFNLFQMLHMPFESVWCDANLRQYCVYGVFRRD